MGRLMAKLLHRLEITKTDTLVEAQRGDLVATHIGQTAVKTRERIDEAKEGLLFVDEAYRLSGGGEKDFGKEAIEELMSAMLHPPGKAPVRQQASRLEKSCYSQGNLAAGTRPSACFDRPYARTILWLGCSPQTPLGPVPEVVSAGKVLLQSESGDSQSSDSQSSEESPQESLAAKTFLTPA